MAKSEKDRRLRKGAKEPYIVEQVPIIDGLSIVRTKNSGRYWYISCYIPANKRYYRKSLRTRDKDAAKKLAIKLFSDMNYLIERGESPFAVTITELVHRYVASQEKRVTQHGRHTGGISQGRLGTISTGLKHLIKFIGAKTKINKISKEQFLEYYAFRLKAKPGTTRDTLKNERSLITAVFKFAVKQGLVRPDFVPEFEVLKTNTQKYSKKEGARDAFTHQERALVLKTIRNWHEGILDAEERYNRLLMRDLIEANLNTGLRPGEMLKLQWSSVELTRSKGNWDVKLHVDPFSKTGGRPVHGVNGNAFAAIRKYSPHTKPSDWVFAEYGNGKVFSRKTRLRLWALMKQETGLDKVRKKLVPYSLRHTYCTERLMERTSIQLIAQNMGTSVKFIEDHYGHVEIDLMKDDLTKSTWRNTKDEEDAAIRAAGEQYRDRGSLNIQPTVSIKVELDTTKTATNFTGGVMGIKRNRKRS